MDLEQRPCYGCGLADPETTCTLASPFMHVAFDYSEESFRTAQNVVDKGKFQLAQLDEALATLQAHRDNLQSVVLHHQTYLSPISRLPDDILLLVFYEVRGITDSELAERGIWLPAAVCRRWRTLALSSSGLWARLFLDLDHADTRQHREVTEEEMTAALLSCRRTRIHLERAGGYPLVCILQLLFADDYKHPYIQRSIRQIVHQLPRCSALTMIGNGPSSWHIFPSESTPFPLLRSLKYARSGSNPEREFPTFFLDTPVLERLAIKLIQLYTPFPESWKALTCLKLDICYATTAELIELLCFTESLTRLYLRIIKLPREYLNDLSLSIPSVTKDALLLHLSRLLVDFVWSSEPEWPWIDNPRVGEKIIWAALHHIKCPNLGTVVVRDPTAQRLDLQAIQSCILASDKPSSIHTLEIDDLGDEDIADHFIALISHLPCLETVLIEAWHHGDHSPLLTALKLDNTDERSLELTNKQDERDAGKIGPCPQLTWLKLCRLRLDSGVLRDLILNRSAKLSGGKLLFVTVEGVQFTDDDPTRGDDPFDWLRQMESEGILKGVYID